MIRKTVHYSGQVQGVGFRWTTQRIAGGYDVTGYVRNLPDGRVELIVEGKKTEVDAMLDELARTMAGHIRDARIDTGSATGQFQSFNIAH
jgi:acylphosphatase